MPSYAILRFQMGFDPKCCSASYSCHLCQVKNLAEPQGRAPGPKPKHLVRVAWAPWSVVMECHGGNSRSPWIFQVMCQVVR